MIHCCNGCTARRLRCHAWGECVHYMHEKAKQENINQQRLLEIAGAYYPNDSERVNRHKRQMNRKRTER